MSKEEEEKAERKKTPPTPPIRNKGGKGEEESTTPASAGARDKLTAKFDVHTPPTLEVALEFAKHELHCDNEAVVREWHETMENVMLWCDSKTGLPIRHWRAHLRAWIYFEKRSAAKGDKRNHFGKRPVNWLAPTEGEDYANSPF